MSKVNPFSVAQHQLDEAARRLSLDPAAHEFLRWPQREYHFTLPVVLDDGATRIFRAFRVQYNTSRGPAKGGLRWHPDESIDRVRALAAWMTWKTAVLDLPLGGGKGGIACSPKSMSIAEKQRLARAYVRAVGAELGLHRDIPAPDVNTTPQIMAWTMDEFETRLGRHEPGVITGKPVSIGGSAGRDNATSYGGLCIIREVDKLIGISLDRARFAIQGFGNVGGGLAKLLYESSGHVVAISAEDGAIHNDKGINIPKALDYYESKAGHLAGFDGGDAISNEQLLACACDVLVPAAVEHVLTERNAGSVQAKIIVELANGPSTPQADKIFQDRGVLVVPDILANAGGVTVSYFESVQNAHNYAWSPEEIRAQLDRRMTAAFRSVHQVATEKPVDHRLAAYLLAVDRVAHACRLRGWV